MKKKKSKKQKDKNPKTLQTCSIFGFWHNPRVNLIPAFPSLSFLMTQGDKEHGWLAITACWDSSCSISWEDTSLRLPGCFPPGGNNSSSASHKAIWIKRRRKPIENTFPAVSSLLTKLWLQPARGEGCSSSPENSSIPGTAPPPDLLHMVTSPVHSSSPGRCVGISVSFETSSTWPPQMSLSTPCLFFYRDPTKCSHSKPTR